MSPKVIPFVRSCSACGQDLPAGEVRWVVTAKRIESSKPKVSNVTEMRVFCDSCKELVFDAC